MKLHLSVDDVIYSLMDLCSQAPDSVFDIPFWCLLRDLNKKYGALFTIYAFEDYAESFRVNCIQKKYWAEFADCKFIRFGFHGIYQREKNELFERKCIDFYSCFPEVLRADTIRLHRYEADPSMIGLLRRYGVSAILCREDESRKINDFPPSYMFTENEEKRIGTVPVKINGMNFVKTSLRIELHEEIQLLQELNELISKSSNDAIIAVFTHEKFVSEYSDSIESVCKLVNKRSNIDFTF